MEITEFNKLKSQCTRNEPVFCSNQCPLGVDVRGMIDKLVSGNFRGAYNHYSMQVLFPNIVSRLCDEPCRNACIRKNIDEPIAVRMLEKACCDYSNDKDVPAFYIPPKKQRVAIIGGGLGGMSCAVKLASKGYKVHVYEVRDYVGGWLWSQESPVPSQVLAAEFSRIARNNDINFHLNTRIQTLAEIEFDAMYIATGRNGNTFGLAGAFDPLSLATAHNGVFMSSAAAGREECTVLIPMREGMRVARAIEAYLKVGTMSRDSGRYECFPSRLTIDTAAVEHEPSVKPANQEGYTAAEAVTEAKRCLGCECTSCMAACELIAFYKKQPPKIIEDVIASLNVVTAITTRVASRQINSCNICGLCKEVCPESLDLEAIFLASRRALHKEGKLPPAFHDFWLKDMEFSNSEDAFFSYSPGSSRYLFFPGCQLGASDPEYVTAAYHYLVKHLNGGVSIMVGCCGAPADWAGREKEHLAVIAEIKNIWLSMGRPLVILACPTCKKMFEQHLPEIAVASLWKLIAVKGLPENQKTGEEKIVTVFDSCASRYDSETRNSVRTILRNSGYELRELAYSGERSQCCGYGGQIQAVNPGLFDKIVNHRVNATPYTYVTYCTNCRDTFANAKKMAVHLLDILFNNDIDARAARKPPTLTQRRENRIKLKKQLLRLTGGMDMAPATNDYSKIKVYISPELFAKMDRNLIIAEDAQRTVQYCESTGNKIQDTATGQLIGHLANGVITYWVVYRPEGDGFRLESIYSHRLTIEENVP